VQAVLRSEAMKGKGKGKRWWVATAALGAGVAGLGTLGAAQGLGPNGPVGQEQPEPAWTQMALAVANAIVAKDWPKVTARFDAALGVALPADKMAAGWASVLAGAGAFVRIEKTDLTETSGHHVVALTCAFQRTTLTMKIVFDDHGAVSGLRFVPAVGAGWAPPGYGRVAVDEHAVSVGPARLPGKLVLPRGTGPWPAVVLVHGSGPHDEDETTGGSRPFHDLALGLAAKGVASLRYVKRTAVVPEQFTPDRRFTVREETVDDARAAVALLAATRLVDPSRVWVVGHSLGGYLAPRIAEGNPQVAGIVVLAGPTRPMEDLVIEQTRYLSRGDADHGTARVAKAEAAARAARDPALADGTVVDFLGAKLPGSYFLDMRRYHPATLAASLSIPILVLQGGRDFQVGRADYDGWAKALGGHLDATLKLYPALNHLFEVGSGPPGPEEYGRADQHVAEEVVVDIAKCITQSPARR
jgi:uncharacterized protein